MTEEEIANAEIAQAEKIGLGDLVIAAVLAAVTWVVLTVWEFPGLYPGVWDDATVAAWVRPASHVMPGYWTILAQYVFRFFGMGEGIGVLRLLGHGSLAFTAVCVYLLMREALTFVMRARPQHSARRTLVMRLAAVIGTFAFVSMDPVWTAGQFLSETTVLLVLTVLALESYLLFLRKGAIGYAYLAATFLGLLAAETPIGFLLPIGLASLYLFVVQRVPNLESPLFKPAVMEVGKWHMTFLYFAAFVAGVAVNSWTYVSHGGLGAAGETLGYLPLAYVLGYWNLIVSAAGLTGWLMLFAICFTPFAVTLIRFPTAADEDRFLPYATGLIVGFCGVLALTQAAFLPALWFWTYFPLKSQYLLVLGLLCCAFTLAAGMTTLGVDSLCRNHERLAKTLFGVDEDDGDSGAALRQARLGQVLKRLSLAVVPLVLVALIVPGRIKTTTRLMLDVVRDAVAEIVSEAGDARFLFTDGSLDAGIEFEAARRGVPLRCYSLMGGKTYAAYLRTRGLTDDSEDSFSFGFDAGTGLRSWIRDKPARLRQSAALLGFDLWKRDAKPLPPMGGLLSRPTGFADERTRLAGVTNAYALADRVLAVHARRSGLKSCSDAEIRRTFLAVQWRLARMCTYRSEADDLAARAERAIAEARRAKTLNDLNPTYKELLKSMERRNEILMQKLTPREGLQLALVRADFTMGKAYAETVLGVDANNPDANFTMGMYYLQRRQLSLAETYLKRCLIRKPRETAVYNNLAMIQIELRKFDAAEVNVRKALELAPNSAAVLDTKKALEAARKK